MPYGQEQQNFNPQLMQAIAQQEQLRNKQQSAQNMMQPSGGAGGMYDILGAVLGGVMNNKLGKQASEGEVDIQQQIQAFQQQKAQEQEQRTNEAYITKRDEERAYQAGIAGNKHKNAIELKGMNKSIAPVINVTNGEKARPPTPMQGKMATKYADKYEKWESEAIVGNEMMGMLQQMSKISELQATGKAQEAGAMIGQWFGSEAGANMQVYNSIQKKMMLDAAEKMSGAMSEGEWDILGQLMPSFGSDPRANAQINKIMTGAAERSIGRFNESADYFDKNKTLEGYRPPFQFSGRNKPKEQLQTPDFSKMSDAEVQAQWNARNK